MKKIFIFILVVLILLPSFGFADSYNDLKKNYRVFSLGILSTENIDLYKRVKRSELAAIAIKLKSLEDVPDYKNSNYFKDVKGWAAPYVDIARELNLMNEVKEKQFYPNEEINYIDLLVVLMRVLGYEDGVDFKRYPEDYYNKALEIGLANLYIPYNDPVNKDMAASTINKALDLNIKGSSAQLIALQSSREAIAYMKDEPRELDEKISLDDFGFDTNFFGIFHGRLKGRNDFSGYKISILLKSGKVIQTSPVNNDGSFSLEGFDISTLSKLQGYKYEVYSPNNTLILWDDVK